VKVLRRIKPKSNALLAVPNPCSIDIGLENICLSGFISKKFKVELIMLSTQRGSLPKNNKYGISDCHILDLANVIIFVQAKKVEFPET
jgi:hypothetical protein